ncbi:MAG: aldehyde dehydrogenase family protein [Candidatus Latescibacteria bacterium]|nr:aldehyde dehydrogenase family protein [Candidatus Latescibacterota bacterium]NIO29001.1 aldehyde dehydrogenase family protein [Candidatus Latescibacterota bacterium]NIO56626.1 aldehyde dehydrogenase family protein [Candidatus Latescibacterota bacterium]NIT02210.1 aldehyde dehydrogenase family protein [Candidatus Latescibacterota bacterium]NIT39095.1 aldehyde dehydrogenase family protein [Candidatus Latescibacterota bacterium]
MRAVKYDFLGKLGIKEENSGAFCGDWLEATGKILEVKTPIDGTVIAKVKQASSKDYEKVMAKAVAGFKEWRMIPAPKRGEVVRQIGHEFRKFKDELSTLVTLEMGKILVEGEGEVQEMIDMADFAVGQSRMLYGLTLQSERPLHRMMEQWHPLGVVGIITAFNFPVAVWSWNTFLALVCGDATIWKPASKTPLTGIACMNITRNVLKANNCPDGIVSLVVGSGSEVGELMVSDKRIPLVSATGSTPMGKKLAEKVSARLGRTILELGGNNGIIVTPSADIKMVIPSILFGAVGTAGQRCTTTRRIIVHESIEEHLIDKLVNAYKQVRIGNPLDEGTLMGPLVAEYAVEDMTAALERIKKEGGEILYGGEKLGGNDYPGGCYVTPCIVRAKNEWEIVQEETFAPILYIIKYKEIDEAIALHNGVPQGLSSAIFSNNLREVEQFLSPAGSDCGIANANIGTSGAEIGGAFGGEKDTGGGRESGSDAWKAYMRRQTNTINWSTELPLAQGIKFGDSAEPSRESNRGGSARVTNHCV